MIYDELDAKTEEAAAIYKDFIDQLIKPKAVQPPTANSLLADRVKRIATDLYLSGDEYGANVLYEAAEAIRGIE